MTPNEPPTAPFMLPSSPFPYQIQARPVWPPECGRVTVCDFWSEVIRSLAASTLTSWNLGLGMLNLGSQPPFWKKPMPHREEATSWHSSWPQPQLSSQLTASISRQPWGAILDAQPRQALGFLQPQTPRTVTTWEPPRENCPDAPSQPPRQRETIRCCHKFWSDLINAHLKPGTLPQIPWQVSLTPVEAVYTHFHRTLPFVSKGSQVAGFCFKHLKIKFWS